MSEAIEGVAKSWLTDQPYQKVFKHTFDVVADYISYALIALGALVLSVKLVTTLSSGDLVCIIVGVTMSPGSNYTVDQGSLGPYASGGTLGMLSYAQTNQGCISAFFTPFEEYLPFLMLMQTMLILVVEKISYKMPRIAQKIERFYTNIVEGSMFGKDPDAAEDLTDPKNSSEVISRQRQRNEICVSLKRSSIIYYAYLARNLFEIFILVVFFIPINMTYALNSSQKAYVKCSINLAEVTGLVDATGKAHFQCQGRKISFFRLMVWVHVGLLICYGICSLGGVLWVLFFRSITRLLGTIEKQRTTDDITGCVVESGGGGPGTWGGKCHKSALIGVSRRTGKDFLFLFDLLAHTCGIESTLRVLTHSDDNFHEIFKPNLNPLTYLTLEEDKLKIEWYSADVEKWQIMGSNRGKRAAGPVIDIDCYEVSIFPAEKVKNTVSIPAKSRLVSQDIRKSILSDDVYSTWFFDLNGGRTEYVITIACMVGKSRMKGEKVVTNLVPYGAEKPRSGMLKTVGTHQAEIFWDPPKGEFTKYALCVDRVSHSTFTNAELASGIFMRASACPSSRNSILVRKRDGSVGDGSSLHSSSALNREQRLMSQRSEDTVAAAAAVVAANFQVENVRIMENLSNKLTTYTLLGLEPGEKYGVELSTKTGNVSTRSPIYELVLTKPKPPRGFRTSEVGPSSGVISWLPPEGNPCLRGFQIQVTVGSDANVIKDVAVPKMAKQFTILGLSPGMDYDVSIASLCVAEEGRRTESEPATLNLTTAMEKVRDLQLESAGTNDLLLKWDPPVLTSQNLKFKVNVCYFANNEEECLDYILLDEDRPDVTQRLLAADSEQQRLGGVATAQETILTQNNEAVEATDVSGGGGQKSCIEATATRLEMCRKLQDFSRTVEVPGDQKSYHFTDLPECIGSGVPYLCTIVASCTTAIKENEATSAEVREVFLTKPLPPRDLRPAPTEPLSVSWARSITYHVQEYKVRYEAMREVAGAVGEEEQPHNVANDTGALIDEATVTAIPEKGLEGAPPLRLQYSATVPENNALSPGDVVLVSVASVVVFPGLIGKSSRSDDLQARFVVNNQMRFEPIP